MSRRRSVVPEDLLRLRLVNDPQVAPDGKRVAFVVHVPDVDADVTRPTVWVSPLTGDNPGVSFAAEGKTHSPRWSPDGRWLAYVSDRGGRPAPQLWVAPLDGGEPRCLTDAPRGVAQPVWSPDGRRIAYVARVGGPAVVSKDAPPAERNAPRVVRTLRARLDGFGWLDGRAQVFVVHLDAADGATPRQITDGDFDHAAPVWSPDGEHLALVADRGPNSADRMGPLDLWVVPARGGRLRRLTGGTGPVGNVAWSPDGEHIAYTGNDAGEGYWSALDEVRVVAADGSAAPRALTRGADGAGSRFLLDGRTLAWEPGGKALLFAAMQAGTVRIQRVTTAARPSISSVVGGHRAATAFDITPDGRHVVFVTRYVDHLPDVRAVALRGDRAEHVVHDPNAELRADVALAPVQRRTHTAADGLLIESFVVRPPRAKARQHTPVVLDIHGGPHAMHPSLSLRMIVATQVYAAAGYTVLMPNPRGSAGYGDEFVAACREDWGGADYDDLMGAVDALIDVHQADPDQLFVFGYSYGGFMTSWVIGHTDRFRAAVIGAPVTNMVSMTGTTDVPFFSVHEMGGLPWDRPDEYAKRSPITYLPDVSTPALIVHHEGDLRCPIGQGEELFALLRLLGKDAEMVRYPGGFHGVAAPSQLADQTARFLAWFDAHRVS